MREAETGVGRGLAGVVREGLSEKVPSELSLEG